jgi:polyisoprenoid-binding protein YceI
MADAPVWTIDAESSNVGFSAKQMNVSVPGRFERFSAAIRFDVNNLSGSKILIDIDVSSTSTPNRDIETEIKREPWFDVASHPIARFETVAFTHVGGERYDIAGQLTLRGVTRTIILPATIRVQDDPDRPETLRAQADGNVEISRSEFGIGQGQWRDVAIVADEVSVHFEIVARRSKTGQ